MSRLILLLSFISLFSIGCTKGDTGPAGPPGVNASSMSRIVRTINCDGIISGLGGFAGAALNGLKVEYDVAEMSSGDLYASANIVDQVRQNFGSSYYSVGQNGAVNAAVIITADYDSTADGGTWSVSLDRQTNITTATYTDSSLGVESPVIMTFAASSCVGHIW